MAFIIINSQFSIFNTTLYWPHAFPFLFSTAFSSFTPPYVVLGPACNQPTYFTASLTSGPTLPLLLLANESVSFVVCPRRVLCYIPGHSRLRIQKCARACPRTVSKPGPRTQVSVPADSTGWAPDDRSQWLALKICGQKGQK